MSPDSFLQLTILLIFSFAVNLPLGYIRESSRKFSLRWFVLIHISIPFIIALRVLQGFSWHLVPLTIGCAIAGQLIGGQLRRKRLP